MSLFEAYRKRPLRVHAVQVTVDNVQDIRDFIGGVVWHAKPNIPGEAMRIETPEGIRHVRYDEYMVRGIAGEFYPMKPEIFEASYDRIV